jgi:hypothetical protein
MVDEWLINWFGTTTAALDDVHLVLGALAWGALLILICAIPLAFTTALRRRRLALAGIVAWQLLLLATLALAPEPLFAPTFALAFFLLRGRVSLKLSWGSALALALYLSLVSLAAAYVTWLSFDRLLAY